LSRFQKGILFFTVAMVLYSLVRGLLYLSYPAEFESLDGTTVMQAFINGLRFDSSIVARTLLFPLLLLWLPLRFFEQSWWVTFWGWVLFLLTVTSVLLLIGDVVYYANVQRHLSYELMLLQNDWKFLLAFGLQSQLGPLSLFAIFALTLAWLWRRILILPSRPSTKSPVKFVGLLLLLVVIGRGGPNGKMIEIIDAYDQGSTAYGNLSLNGVFTSSAFALNMEDVNHHFMPQQEALELVRNGRVPHDAEFPLLRKYEGVANGLNVVFVLLESWNFDYVDSFAGSNHGLTPYFDALAKDGLKFTRFYAAGQRSIEGIQATLTGIPVLKGMPRIDTGIGVSNFSRLGSLVKDKGYSTLFMQSSDRDSYKVQGIAAAAGFDQFYGREDMPLLLDYPDPEGAIFGWDHETLQFMKQKIDTLPQPFLSYVFTGTTHKPYANLPEQFMKLPNEPDGKNGYFNVLGYADWSIGQFMKEARKSPWFDNTIFIFTADHTNFLQHGDLYKSFNIPMLIYSPKHIAAGESKSVGSQLDVLPTMVDLLGIDGEFTALGESLMRKEDGGSAFISVGAQQIALITRNGYLKHDLSRLLENSGIDEASLPQMQKRLLAMDQLTYELLQSNRWAR
jgi:phosphoglycerol transferase MdoB-like AlkP superfamily enzyme